MAKSNYKDSPEMTQDEIDRAKVQLKGNYILSNEHVSARMQAIGRAVLLNRKLVTPEETIQKIEAVDRESVAEIIDRVLDRSTMCTVTAGTKMSH